MIKVESIRIEEFRGIRDLSLTLNGKNFAICGPNGTGKSGVVDALEFVLTGSISRLSGEGSDNLSVKAHAPHVDSRDAPGKSRVTITATIPGLKKTVTIVRTVKAPTAPTISPNTAETVAVVRQLERHPEFVLTRRELIRYVLSPPGKRAKEVQALLRLDRIEEGRGVLQKIAHRCQKAVATAREERDRARDNLARGLGIGQVSSAEILKAVNQQRSVLALQPIVELTATNSVKDGMAATGATTQTSGIAKAQAVDDLAQLRRDIGKFGEPGTREECEEAAALLRSMADDEALLEGMTREQFLRSGLALVDGDACPLCDTGWDTQRLRDHITSKLAKFAAVALKRSEAERKLGPVVALLSRVLEGVDTSLRYGTKATAAIDLAPLRELRWSFEAARQQLERMLPLDKTVGILMAVGEPAAAALKSIEDVEGFIAKIPEPTKQDAAREFLTVAQERLQLFRAAAQIYKKCDGQATQATAVFKIYGDVSTAVLEAIYRKVESDFAELYREINREDEEGFTAKLTPSLGKLGFDVDFYGRGQFPPGAYHSEGHQDAMGLCLYLALMRHLQQGDFAFAVLDDVLMSVDSGHRREVCSLLKGRFADTQLIFTTHDPIWLRHMKTEGVLGQNASVQFRTWHVDHGPTEWDDRDVWEEIDGYLAAKDVRAASGLLRYFLEYIGGELCHRLRAPVEFRGDAQYQLGDILPRAAARLKELYGKGRRAAASWGQSSAAAAIAASADSFAELVKKSDVERWQINPAVHYNAWLALESTDFIPVVKAHKALIEGFRCQNADCRAYLYLVPERGSSQVLRCDCNAVSMNLVER